MKNYSIGSVNKLKTVSEKLTNDERLKKAENELTIYYRIIIIEFTHMKKRK